jgi:hypothetical protein
MAFRDENAPKQRYDDQPPGKNAEGAVKVHNPI